MPLGLPGRMLCAATQAYMVRAMGAAPGTNPPPTPPRSDQAGYALPVQGFASGGDLIDAGLVGLAPDAIVVAFRGTLPPTSQGDVGQTLLDWATDADAPLVPGANLPGLVHQGFLGALDALWPSMSAAVLAFTETAPGLPVWITGHSKGGAVAYLAAARLKALHPALDVRVTTFAAARCGDATFAAGYARLIPMSDRYEYADDLVPHLPPRAVLRAALEPLPFVGAVLGRMAVGYESVGRLRYIPRGAPPLAPPQNDSPALELARINGLVHLLSTFAFATVKADHSIDAGSGYAGAVGL